MGQAELPFFVFSLALLFNHLKVKGMKEKRIKLKKKLKYRVTMKEKRRLYTSIALIKYHYDCQPDYDSTRLLMRLCRIFGRYNSEILRLIEKEPNNYILHDLSGFLSRHYGGIKAVLKEDARLEQTTASDTTGNK